MRFITLLLTAFISLQSFSEEKFPDGTPIPDWFRQNEVVNIQTLGKKYNILEYGVINDSTLLQTEKIQSSSTRHPNREVALSSSLKAHTSAALFSSTETHLYLEEDAILKGSDDISNFPIIDTRMEGQSLSYFAALVNADKVDGFTISGKGTITVTGCVTGSPSGCAAKCTQMHK